MSDYILEGQNLCQQYKQADGRQLNACRNVNFSLKKGETMGIVGESGCGKSTLLKMLTRLEQPSSGALYFNGADVSHVKGKALRNSRRHIQMVFQDPASAFSPRMKAGEAICEPLDNFCKLSKTERTAKVAELLTQVGLPVEFQNRLCHAMSGGQRQRLGIARALALNPEILVCDEATSALDVSIQATIMELLSSIQKQRNLSMVFVCHDIALVKSISHRIMVMYLGTVVEIMDSKELDANPMHPYTQLLMSSIFSTSMDKSRKIPILDGEVPSPLDAPKGCPYHTRCGQAMDICKTKCPTLQSCGQHHQVACHLYDQKDG